MTKGAKLVVAQELNFYTRLYDNFMDDEMCDAYVASFEETMEERMLKR